MAGDGDSGGAMAAGEAEAEAEAIDATVRENTYRVQALKQQDLDRNYSLATTHLFKWMQAARMDLPWLQTGYRALGLLAPAMLSRRLLNASQSVRLVRPGVLAEAADHEVVTVCEVGSVGKTSIEFRYRIFFADRLVGTGCTIMIVVGGEPGKLKPSPVPEAVKRLAAPSEGEDRQFLLSSMDGVSKQPPEGAYAVPLVVRYSDEDLNKHANHTALPRYFEDTKEAILADVRAPAELRALAGQQLAAVLVGYTAEARAEDRCEVRVARGAAEGALDLWVVRLAPNRWGGKPGLIGRGRLVCGGGPPPSSEELRVRSTRRSEVAKL